MLASAPILWPWVNPDAESSEIEWGRKSSMASEAALSARNTDGHTLEVE